MTNTYILYACMSLCMNACMNSYAFRMGYYNIYIYIYIYGDYLCFFLFYSLKCKCMPHMLFHSIKLHVMSLVFLQTKIIITTIIFHVDDVSTNFVRLIFGASITQCEPVKRAIRRWWTGRLSDD